MLFVLRLRIVVLALFAYFAPWGWGAWGVELLQDSQYVYQVVPWGQYILRDDARFKKMMESAALSLQDIIFAEYDDGTPPMYWVPNQDALASPNSQSSDGDEQDGEADGEPTNVRTPLVKGFPKNRLAFREVLKGVQIIAERCRELNELFEADALSMQLAENKTRAKLLAPDAFMLFLGWKSNEAQSKKSYTMALNALTKVFRPRLGAGVSVSLGVVFMPVWVQRINKFPPHEMSSGWNMRTSLVLWTSPGVSYGARVDNAKSKNRLRLGGGLIWGGKNFNSPDQFKGLMLGAAATHALKGRTASYKAGVLVNKDLPGGVTGVDFFYASTAVELGGFALRDAATGLEVHASGGIILGTDQLPGMVEKAETTSMKRIVDKMTRGMVDSVSPAPPVKRRTDGRVPCDPNKDPKCNPRNRRRPEYPPAKGLGLPPVIPLPQE